jgi:hypothetical protein
MTAKAECVANIGPAGRRQRTIMGVVGLAIGVAAAVALVVLGVARPWRLALLLPFLAGGVGIFQARAKT